MNLLQGPDGDVGIDLGRLQLHMAEDFLDEADVGSVLVHQGRHRVAEETASAGLSQHRRVDPGLHIRGQMVAAERLPAGREEDGHIVRFQDELRTGFVDVFPEPSDGPLPDGNIAVFLALALLRLRSGLSYCNELTAPPSALAGNALPQPSHRSVWNSSGTEPPGYTKAELVKRETLPELNETSITRGPRHFTDSPSKS